MGGLKNKLCFNNSLHQTAAAVRLSPVCIKPVSELRLHFKSDSSAETVRLSDETDTTAHALITVGSILPPMKLPTTARVLRHLVAVRLTKYDSE